MKFIVLSSFIGKCIRESWIKPTVLPNKAWKPYLLKAPFHIISFNQMLECAKEEISKKIGKGIPHFINKDPNEREILITAIFILSISASTTYMIPGLNLIFGTVAIGTLFGIGVGTASEKSDVSELVKLGSTSLKLAMLIAVGGTIGKLTRSIIEPKNHTLPYSRLTNLLLLPQALNHLSAFTMLIGLSFLKGKEQEFLDSIDREIPQLDQYVSAQMTLIEKTVEYAQTLRGETVAELKQKIPDLQDELEILRPEFKRLRAADRERRLTGEDIPRYHELANTIKTASFRVTLISLVVQLSESKNQEAHKSIDELTRYFEALRNFYNKVTGKEVVDYIPKRKEELGSKEEEERDLLQRLQNISLRGSDRNWTKEQAAYLLLIPVGNGDEQRRNYQHFSLWFHPDKNDGIAKYTEIFKAITKANETLDS